MNTIYWITRLDAICTALVLLDTVLVLVLAFCCFSYLSNLSIDSWRKEEQEQEKKLAKRIGKKSCIALVITTLLLVFIPSTKEAFAIYGIGGTIDYVKSNDKAKRLPDKVIDALDRYVDTIANDSVK